MSSNFDPVDVTEYTKAEIKAAVADAESCGTYVTVHSRKRRARPPRDFATCWRIRSCPVELDADVAAAGTVNFTITAIPPDHYFDADSKLH